MTSDQLRPELKTWRMAEVALAAVGHALEAAKAENLQSMVGNSLRQAGLYLAGACTTLEMHLDDSEQPLPPTTMVPLSINDIDQLIALVTGFRDKVVAIGAGSSEMARQLVDLRDRLIQADRDLREATGLPLD